MIIWINGCFGVGKTETANRLGEMIENSHIYDPEQVRPLKILCKRQSVTV